MSPTTRAAPKVLTDRLASLASALELRPDALALLGLGSVGLEVDRMDEWSDLDFFVLVADGAKSRYLSQLDWLSDVHPLSWHFQNTADGHKVLMTDGLFCEFAVFEVPELGGIPYAPGRFVWRRDGVEEALACPRQPMPTRHDATWLLGEALSNLIVGLQRHARGERLAAMRMIQVYALDRVLELLEQQHPAANDIRSARDPFNVERRIEARCGLAASALPLWAGGYMQTVSAALGLLTTLQTHAHVPKAVAEHILGLASASVHA